LAAAESLKQQAQQLVQAVAVFKLSAGDTRAETASAAPVVTPAAKPVPAKKPMSVKKPVAVAAKAAPAKAAPAPTPVPATTAPGDDWQSF
jgi:methyl-accepting chemotaxis protein